MPRNTADTADTDDFNPLTPIPNPFVADAISKLPPRARARYLEIDRLHDKADADHDARFQRVQNLQRRQADARIRLDAYRSELQLTKHDSEESRKQLRQYERAVGALKNEIAATIADRAPGSVPLEAIWDFFAKTRTTRWTDAPVSVTTPKNQTPLDALEKKREEIEATKKQIGKTQRAQHDLKSAIRRMESEIRSEAKKGEIKFARVLYDVQSASGRVQPGRVGFPVSIELHEDQGEFEIPQGVAALCWLFEDEIIKRGRAALRKAARTDALTSEQRASKLRELEVALHKLRCEEEAVSRICDAKGIPVERSAADIPAILMIEPRVGGTAPSDDDDFEGSDADDFLDEDAEAARRDAARDAHMEDWRQRAEKERRRRRRKEREDEMDFG